MSKAPKVSTKTRKPEKPPREPTLRERAALDSLEAYAREKGTPSLQVTGDAEPYRMSVDHPDALTGQLLIMEAIGTRDPYFYDVFMSQLFNAGTQGRKPDPRGINFMLSVVKGIEPRDQVEAMLGAQMAAVHSATMTFARRLAHVENIPQQDAAEKAFNKLARTFAMQMEALKRYRSTGTQSVVVQHVNVNHGGQAIVGNVGSRATPGRGGEEKAGEQPHAKQITDAPFAAMPSPIEEDRRTMQESGGERLSGMPDARRPRRRAAG